jgi:hypothetical protein
MKVSSWQPVLEVTPFSVLPPKENHLALDFSRTEWFLSEILLRPGMLKPLPDELSEELEVESEPELELDRVGNRDVNVLS